MKGVLFMFVAAQLILDLIDLTVCFLASGSWNIKLGMRFNLWLVVEV